VLEEIDAGDVPQLQVMNKIDLAGGEPRIVRDVDGVPQQVWISAATGQGLDLLREALGEVLGGDRMQLRTALAIVSGSSACTASGRRRDRRSDEYGWRLRIDAPRSVLAPLTAGRHRAAARFARQPRRRDRRTPTRPVTLNARPFSLREKVLAGG
jgi:GTP-binding protein HflX